MTKDIGVMAVREEWEDMQMWTLVEPWAFRHFFVIDLHGVYRQLWCLGGPWRHESLRYLFVDGCPRGGSDVA